MLKKWILKSKESVLENPWLGVEKRVYSLPNGKEKEYFHLNRPDYVLIIAVDIDGKLAVERQYRRGVDNFVYELPAGWIDKGETPEQAAVREVKEELKYETKDAVFLGEIYAQPGFSSMKAKVVKVVLESPEQVKSKEEADEFIEFSFMSKKEVTDLIKSNTIKDMGCLAALSLYL